MELAFMIFFAFLWIVTAVFLGFWIRNLIVKLKTIAEKKQELSLILQDYFIILEDIYNNDLYGGLPAFKDAKNYTSNLIKYLNENLEQDVIKFIYDKE